MTHKLITSKLLRQAYARELWNARQVRRDMPPLQWIGIRYGLESGIWAAQKAIL